MSLKIREFQNDDLDVCLTIYKNTFSKEPWFDDVSDDEKIRDLFLNHMRNNYFLGYILSKDETVIGFTLGFQKAWLEGMEYYIDHLAIDYDYQKEGYGSQFLSLIEKDVKDHGMNAIILNTEKGVPAEHFYKKNGFKHLEEIIVLAK